MKKRSIGEKQSTRGEDENTHKQILRDAHSVIVREANEEQVFERDRTGQDGTGRDGSEVTCENSVTMNYCMT